MAQSAEDLTFVVVEITTLNIASRDNQDVESLGKIVSVFPEDLANAPFDKISHRRSLLYLGSNGNGQSTRWL